MIVVVVGLLILVLAVLLIDWQGIARRKEVAVKMPKIPKLPKLPTLKMSAPKLGKGPIDPLPDLVAEPMLELVTPPDLEDAAPIALYQPSSEVEELLNEADVHFRKGEIKAAEQLYLQAAAKDPRCSKAYSRLGVIYLENGESWDDAEEAFRQALKTDPENGFILNNLGLVLYHQDKFADAIRHFEAAVRLDDLNAARHANLGMGYMAIRQYAKAESAFKKALKLAPAEMEYKDLLNEAIEKKKAHKTMVRR